jgi:hypothetical protein
MATENYLLTINGGVMGSPNQTVLCFQSAGLASNDTLDAGVDLINAFAGNLEALWLACLPGTYSLNMYAARRAFPKPSAVAKLQYDASQVTGQRGSNATSYNLCPVIFLVPPMGTKSGGKVFMPAVPQGDIINNQYVAGYLTATSAFFNAAIAGAAGSGTNWKLAIYSRKLQSVQLAQSFSKSLRLGFQGRRRTPVGVS